jgi:hypothetical protein
MEFRIDTQAKRQAGVLTALAKVREELRESQEVAKEGAGDGSGDIEAGVDAQKAREGEATGE